MANKHNRRNWLGDFDFLAALLAVLFGPGTGEPELKPIPVRVRRR
jgi:hypothetical protein